MNAEECSAPQATDLVVDTLRQLLTVLGALLASPAGQQAVSDAKECRSVPAISKVVKKLWFNTPLQAWDSKEEVVWISHLLCVNAAARAGILSFYGAGIIVCDTLVDFAKVALEEQGFPLDEAWIDGVLAVERILRGRHFEQLQKWPADRHCGGGKTDLLSTSRLPCTVRRTLDLDGKRLSKVQAAGLGVAMLVPGSFTVGFSAITLGLLYKKARDHFSSDGTRETDPWQRIQSQCMQDAHAALRRKNCPIEVRYLKGEHGLPKVRICLYSMKDVICAIPAGGINSDSVVVLEDGQRASLRPKSGASSFRLRVFRPGLLDVALNDGVEVRRGDQIAFFITDVGTVRFFAEPRQTSAEPRQTSGASSSTCVVQAPEDSLHHVSTDSPKQEVSHTMSPSIVEESSHTREPDEMVVGFTPVHLGACDLECCEEASSSDCLVEENGKPLHNGIFKYDVVPIQESTESVIPLVSR